MGPLEGIRIVEFAGIGAGPFAAMLLADMGAEVVRIDRKAAPAPRNTDVTLRGRRTVLLDLKLPASRDTALKLIEKSDGLIEAFRPGVMERLGLGPDTCLARNPRLVYGRMTGFGQTGPLAPAAGHDLNYLALAGALDAIGTQERPVPPLNLIGDFGGGALYLAFGIVCALLEARGSGQGQVVDAAMSDGAISLMSVFYGLRDTGFMSGGRGGNLLDGGAHFYNTYETADGKWVAVAAIEPQFYERLLKCAGLAGPAPGAHMDRATWTRARAELAAIFKSKPRAAWDAIFAGADACYTPVLSMHDAPAHPHNLARRAFVERDGITQPAPAPRFSRTPGMVQSLPDDTGAQLADWGLSPGEIAALTSDL